MSKSVATTIGSFSTRLGGICAALSALTLPPSVAAAEPYPPLRRSETLDSHRIGRLPTEERAVLRVEWRAAATGGDEARAVQAMLDSVRRMEVTVVEIGHLIRTIPSSPPAAAAVISEAGESEGRDSRWIAANIAAASLLALWWYRRRKLTKNSAAAATANTTPEVVPPAGEGAIADTPVATAPTRVPARSGPPPPSPRPAAESTPIDFSLEEADPEAVARENARLEKLPPAAPFADASQPSESNLEPNLELAEIMLSMGLEQSAARTLVEYAEAHPRDAVYHWLKLLGIYRQAGMRQDFTETAEKLRKNFNIQADDWEREGAGDSPTLEKFPRVAQHVQQIWVRRAECINYLQRLLEDNREGERAGFPQPVAEEMLLLVEILKETSGANRP